MTRTLRNDTDKTRVTTPFAYAPIPPAAKATGPLGADRWAAHKPEAIRVGVPAEIIQSIKLRKPSDALEAPFGTVVELIREALPQDQ